MQQSETTKGLTAYRLQSPSASCLHLHLIILKVHLHPIEDEFQPLSLFPSDSQTHANTRTAASGCHFLMHIFSQKAKK